MFPVKTIVVSAVICVAAVAVSGCKKDLPAHDFGPASATGTLIRADVSLIRRGSHALIVESKKKYYVESRSQNLRDYEGRTVFITGKLEPNTDDTELPVLVAEHVKGPTANEDLHRFEVPSLNLRLGIPESWKGTLQNGAAVFALAGEAEPLMTIRQMSGSSLPAGSTLFIKNRRTSRVDTVGGASDLFILDQKTVIQIRFDTATQKKIPTKEEADIIAAQFERVLSTISFINDREAAAPETGSGSGNVCGGAAGLVCGAGYFCNITDFENRIGSCKKR